MPKYTPKGGQANNPHPGIAATAMAPNKWGKPPMSTKPLPKPAK